MTRDALIFAELQQQKQSEVTFGDADRSNILGIGMTGKNSISFIKNFHLADGFRYNLMSIS